MSDKENKVNEVEVTNEEVQEVTEEQAAVNNNKDMAVQDAIPEDDEVSAIVRWRYIIKPPHGNRYTWRQVNMKVYGYPDYQYSMRRLHRYLETCTKKTNEQS